MCRRPMYQRSACSSVIRPKKSPAPGLLRSSRASATVTSTYSEVISSADADGSTARNRSIIASRHLRANRRWSRSTSSSGNRSAATGSPTLASGAPTASHYAADVENEDIAEPVDGSAPDQAVLEDELLIEEISIDGMCGVY